ncbi:hypothetical protein CHELA40_40195 [Chelatococcus asaccharovorans]|nr:hypothetical protein CHELA17_50263 [Chelatococcus asaccharovorans]CAH1690249.1 hypothetical protein CHELA40_40195 [Chelatococcus asaccharovorans]
MCRAGGLAGGSQIGLVRIKRLALAVDHVFDNSDQAAADPAGDGALLGAPAKMRGTEKLREAFDAIDAQLNEVMDGHGDLPLLAMRSPVRQEAGPRSCFSSSRGAAGEWGARPRHRRGIARPARAQRGRLGRPVARSCWGERAAPALPDIGGRLVAPGDFHASD